MIDSHITGNTSDCQELMQTHETITAHEADCTCDSCCQTSTSNCQDNRDQCEETELTGKVKKMKTKFVPIIANCAVILAIGLSGSIKEITAVDIISANNIAAINRQIIPDIQRLDIVDANRSIINATNVRVPIEQIDAIEISSNQIVSINGNAIAG